MSTRSEVRSPTSTRTEVRSPTRTATHAYTRGNFTSTVTGGAGAGATKVTINIPGMRKDGRDTGGLSAVNSATIVIANPSSDTGALGIGFIDNMNPRVKAAGIGGIAGVLASSFLFPKHKVIGFGIGAALGAFYSQQVENAAIMGPSK